jgi:bifunctional DNase/RNase
MKKYILMGLSVLFIASLGLITLSKGKAPPFIEMEVKGVRIDPASQSPVVILADKEEKKALPIWIGLLEANAINKELNQIPSSRPMTHDLLHSILAQAQVKVNEVKIVDLKEQTYYATLFLTLNKAKIEIDARPSDAIILALKSKVPILVSAKILDQQGLALSMKEDFGERHGLRIQKLTPSLASHFNFKGEKGVLVSEVLPESLSGTSGIKAGDIITKINQKEVGSVKDFEEMFDTLKAGSAVRILFFRDEKFQEANLSLKP